jgi:hypothetical protein
MESNGNVKEQDSMANMSIAKMHRRSRKLVGWLTAAGPWIALGVSFFTVVAGVVLYATLKWPTQWAYWIVAGIIGTLFSVLVERLTLTQSAKVRTLLEKREDINTHYATIHNLTEENQKKQQRELDATNKPYNGAVALMLAGALISTAAGTLFWHYLLQALPGWQAWGFSTLFSAIVSFTLVSSELHRRLDNEVIAESITADHFIGAAGREDARDNIFEQFADKHEEALEHALDADTVKQMADITAQNTLDEVFKGSGSIPIYIAREREAKRIANERERLLTEQQQQQLIATREERNSDKANAPKPTRRLTQILGFGNNNKEEVNTDSLPAATGTDGHLEFENPFK